MRELSALWLVVGVSVGFTSGVMLADVAPHSLALYAVAAFVGLAGYGGLLKLARDSTPSPTPVRSFDNHLVVSADLPKDADRIVMHIKEAQRRHIL